METSFYKFVFQEMSTYPIGDNKSSLEWRSRMSTGLALEKTVQEFDKDNCKVYSLFSELYGIGNSGNFICCGDNTIPDLLESRGEITTERSLDGKTIYKIILTPESRSNLLCGGQENVEDWILLNYKSKVVELIDSLYPNKNYPLPSYNMEDVFKRPFDSDIHREKNYIYLYIYQKYIFPEVLGK